MVFINMANKKIYICSWLFMVISPFFLMLRNNRCKNKIIAAPSTVLINELNVYRHVVDGKDTLKYTIE